MGLTGQEVAEQIRRAIRGEVDVRLQHPKDVWGDGVGNVAFWFGDWSITFFDDAGELDYCDSATAPDGRSGDFDDWCAQSSEDGTELRPDTEPLESILDRAELRKLEMLLNAAK